MVINENKTNLESFFDLSYDDVENKISNIITDEDMKNILGGGKRLRSLLGQLTFKACTQGKEEKHDYERMLEGTVSIELAHGASLVHDDIIDKDLERRGKPAYHAKKGIGNAILMGHKMLTTGFDIALSHGKEVAKLYVDSWNEVVTGEMDEIKFNHRKDQKNMPKSELFDAYRRIIDLKTAALFSSSCKAGVLEANMSGDILKVFNDYGREIGLAYQLADDLVDLVKGEIIDSVILPLLDQIEEKRIKLKFLRKMELKKFFEKNKDKIEAFYIENIKKHLENAEKLSRSKDIPESEYKTLLGEAPSYIINRMLSEINVSI